MTRETFENPDRYTLDLEVTSADWQLKARKNVEEWGLQDMETLLLAAQEELGELTQAVLEYEYEDGSPTRILSELDDLAALCFQIEWAFYAAEDHAENPEFRLVDERGELR